MDEGRARLQARKHRVRRPEKAFAQPRAVIHVKEAVHGLLLTGFPQPIKQARDAGNAQGQGRQYRDAGSARSTSVHGHLSLSGGKA